MNKLSSVQLDRICQHLLVAGPNNVLHTELVDHLACQIEQLMVSGQSFEAAWTTVLDEANTQTVRQLKDVYQRELGLSGEKLRQASLTEMVFEYRNKAYGAYPLRQAYPANVLSALLIGTSVFLMLLAGLNLIGF